MFNLRIDYAIKFKYLQHPNDILFLFVRSLFQSTTPNNNFTNKYSDLDHKF